MSRSNYSDDFDNWHFICWRGAVNSSIRGRRGQALLSEMLSALDAMPDKRLIKGDLETDEGEHCALGVIGYERGLDLKRIDSYDPESVANAFGISRALAQEIAYMNDEWEWRRETPEQRWARMRAWVDENIAKEKT